MRRQAYVSDPYLNDQAEVLVGLEELDRRPAPSLPAREVNHATAPPVRVHLPQPTMREVFERLGFDFRYSPGQWKSEVWANGWGHEPDVLTRAERRALGFKP